MAMSTCKFFSGHASLFALAMLALSTIPTSATAANSCIFDWAVPGSYEI